MTPSHLGDFALPMPPGFVGLDWDRPIFSRVRHLPHWRQEGATYVVTFRLADALPASRQAELKRLRADWETQHPEPSETDWHRFVRQYTRKVDGWLDEGEGACHLRDLRNAELLAEAMRYHDGERYALHAYCIMPNHAHALLRPLPKHTLEQALGGWKRHSAVRINRRTAATGHLWQDECYDRIIRDRPHLFNCLQYIGHNPAKGAIPQDSWVRWVCPDWQAIGWDFDDTVDRAPRFP